MFAARSSPSIEELKGFVAPYRCTCVATSFNRKIVEWEAKLKSWFTAQEEKISEWNNTIDEQEIGEKECLKISPLSKQKILISSQLHLFVHANIPATMRHTIFETITNLLDAINSSYIEHFENLFSICAKLLHLNITLTNTVQTSAKELKILRMEFQEISGVSSLQTKVAQLDLEVALEVLRHPNTHKEYTLEVINKVIRSLFSSDSDSE
mmetsp:Transcript_16592/g.28263  ORF Transcript_16592/g.28263 Transcript_16592/m.28263 type:complete len:210 (+) Transcript_16592:22-651(+)